MKKKWVSYGKDYDSYNFTKELNLPDIFFPLLLNRGINSISAAEEYFFGTMDENLADPYLLKDMDKAIYRLEKAIKNNEKIAIYGDYDVDGITSSSYLYRVFSELGANTRVYIPNRFDEGYGLNDEAVRKLSEEGIELLITVDCGINSIETVKLARDLSLDVIITDHHECGEILPDALAVINPHRPDSEYPFRKLAGVGVAMRLASALCTRLNKKGLEKKYIELVAIGTVADIVSLEGENRIIVKSGLAAIKDSSIPGIKALIEVCALNDKPITSYSIGFVIGPRINAAGRLSSAMLCVELFTTDSFQRGLEIARELDTENRERQKIEQKILEDAILKIESEALAEKCGILVVGGEGWHSGVIGIVASRLVEKYYLPTLIISIDGESAKGSARSISGVNIFELMNTAEDYFEKFGGHEMAAGVSLKTEKISELREFLNKKIFEITEGKRFLPEIKVDYRLDSYDLKVETVNSLKLFEPYGIGNPSPVFVARGIKIISAKCMGADGTHLRVTMFDGEKTIDGVAFGKGDLESSLKNGRIVDVLFSLEINSWNGYDKLQMNIKDIKIIR